jgi:hypothetical protein
MQDFEIDTAQRMHFDLASRVHLGQVLSGEDCLVHLIVRA